MFDALLRWFRRRRPKENAADGFEALNRHAPLRHDPNGGDATAPAASTLLCRETLLGRDQRVAGYRFTLREGMRNRIRRASRIVHHVYAEVLIGNLLQADMHRLLGHRLAFVEIPNSFLSNPCVLRLPPANTVLVFERINDNAGPPLTELLDRMATLRRGGYRFATCTSSPEDTPLALLKSIDFVIIDTTGSDPESIRRLTARLTSNKADVSMIATDIGTVDDFHYVHTLGTKYFHGPFITRREEWQARELSPDVVQARPLLDALGGDRPTDEIVALTKRNPAIALRLLRHANSAAAGLERKIESIETALTLVGRKQLSRWVMMILFSSHPDEGRSHAALESALVRARMLEQLAEHAGGDRETPFLVGLLSLVDVVFQVELSCALDGLGVSTEIREAVVDGKGPHAAPLALAIAWEQGEIAGIEAAASECDVPLEVAAELYMKALWWALDVKP